jgi:hypothetical protein
MVRALDDHATDMIGLARPLTSEPRLCADLVSGKATSSKPNLVDEPIQTGASILQIAAIGKGAPPQDLSDPKVAAEIVDQLKKSSKTPRPNEKTQKDQTPYGQSKI